MWLGASFFDTDCCADHIVDWLAEALPGERTVFVDLDVDDNVLAHHIFGCVVKWIDKIHHVQTPLTERATDRRTCSCASRWDT